MQIKKDEVRNALLNSGEKEFLLKGFEKASLRTIVKKANTTTGNFYNYFKNKEMLFEELIKPDYDKFLDLINNHDKVEKPNYLWEKPDPVLWRKVLMELIPKMIPEFGKGLVLLLESSQGTKYDGSREKLYKLVEEHFLEHLNEFDSNNISIKYINVVATQFINGFIKIIKENEEIEQRNSLIAEHLLFYMIGSMGIIGNFNPN